MNVTLCLLRAAWVFGQSSALNIARGTHMKHTELNRITASRFTAPFLTGASQLRVKDSSFEKFLSRAFHMNGEVIIFDKRQDATNTVAEFISSKFSELGSTVDAGGAIYATSKMICINCMFHKCKGDQGGAIYTIGILTCNRSTFTANQAQEGGSIAKRTQLPFRTCCNLCEFHNGYGNTGAVICDRNGDCVAVIESNSSLCHADAASGFASLRDTNVFIRMCSFYNITSNGFNGNLMASETWKFELNDSLFVFNGVVSPRYNPTGAVIYIARCPPDSYIRQCFFHESMTLGRQAVFVSGTGPFLTITDCCFSGTELEELSNIITNRIISMNNKYDLRSCKMRFLVTLSEIGFSENTEIRTKVENAAPREINNGRIVIFATLATTILYALIDYATSRARKRREPVVPLLTA